MSNAQRRRRSRKHVTKASLTSAIEREGRRLVGLARGLGEEGASRPVVDGWSGRDVIAHCIYWQGMMARLMGAELPPPQWISRTESEADLGRDEVNRRAVEHYRPFQLEGVLADFLFTAVLVRDIVAGMNEENLGIEAGEPWPDGTLVWEAISGETYEHWHEHADRLEAALNSPARARS